LTLKLCDFGAGYDSLYVEQHSGEIRFGAHRGAAPKLRGATGTTKLSRSADRLRPGVA
jgi:hypothetical protein